MSYQFRSERWDRAFRDWNGDGYEWEPGPVQSLDPHDQDYGDDIEFGPTPENIVT